jgi:hypothetical protein
VRNLKVEEDRVVYCSHRWKWISCRRSARIWRRSTDASPTIFALYRNDLIPPSFCIFNRWFMYRFFESLLFLCRNGFQKLEKIKDSSRQSRQLEELTEKMREAKGWFSSFVCCLWNFDWNVWILCDVIKLWYNVSLILFILLARVKSCLEFLDLCCKCVKILVITRHLNVILIVVCLVISGKNWFWFNWLYKIDSG